MEGGDKQKLAAQMAAQRAGAKGGRKPLGGGPQAGAGGGGNSLFNVGEAGGWSMSPKTILLFSVAYMGCVILLHIFGKVTSIKGSKSAEATPEDVGPDNSTQDL